MPPVWQAIDFPTPPSEVNSLPTAYANTTAGCGRAAFRVATFAATSVSGVRPIDALLSDRKTMAFLQLEVTAVVQPGGQAAVASVAGSRSQVEAPSSAVPVQPTTCSRSNAALNASTWDEPVPTASRVAWMSASAPAR